MRPVKKGSTDQSTVIRIIDSTDGTPETGVEHNTTGIDLWYRREGATKTSITEAALAALDTAHTDGGIEHIGDGYYRLDLPDAAFASGADGVMIGGTVTGMIVIGTYHPLVDYDPYDSTRLGLTALPNANAGAASGLPTDSTGKTSFNDLSASQVNAECDTALTDYDAPTKAEMDSAFTEIKGTTWSSGTDTLEHIRNKQTDIETDTQDLQTQIGTAGAGLTNMPTVTLADGAHGGASASITLSSYSDFTGSAAANPNVLQEGTITVTSQTVFTLNAGSADDDAYNNMVIVLEDASTATQKSVRTITDYVGSTKTVTIDSAPDFTIANTDNFSILAVAPGSTPPTTGQIADAVWDEAISGHTTAGTFGAKNQKVVPSETVGDYKADVSGLATAANLQTVDENVDAILVDTGTTIPAQITNLNDLSAAQVNAECDTALADYGANTTTPPTVAAIADGVWDESKTGHSTAGTFGESNQNQVPSEALNDYKADVSALATAAALATVDTVVDAIKLKTDLLPTDPADQSQVEAAINALNDITVADIISGIADGSYDLQEMVRIMFAVLAGKSNGGGTSTINFRDAADAKNRVSATVDANDNRTAVTLDGA